MSSVSELILNQGPFSPVWIAGTMKDKIGKKAVLSTDIADIAKKIMDEDRVNLVLRLSGMLLKGLVVVYSKKTQYMLSDCEDIITKIMQSFKTNAVNLQQSARPDDALTISYNPKSKTIDLAIGDAEAWLKEKNPEGDFMTKPTMDLEFSFSESSQQLTQLSDSSSTSAMSSQLTNFPSDTFVEQIEPPEQQQEFEPLPMPQWNSDDDVAVPTYNDDFEDNQPVPDDTETETDVEPGKPQQPKVRPFDKQIDLRRQRRAERPRQKPTSNRRTAALPQNEELEQLFELARQEFSKPPNQTEVDLDTSDFVAQPVEDIRSADIPNNSDSDFPEPPAFNDFNVDDDNDPSRRISLPDTPNDYLTDFPRRYQSSTDQTPITEVSPYPKTNPGIKFAIEKTPKRSVEDSITKETISILNDLKKALKDKESITFDQAFSGSSRHHAAMAFYQMLVLRSTGYTIGIQQEKPYDPITILPDTSFSSI